MNALDQNKIWTSSPSARKSKRRCIWSPCRTTGHFLLLVFDDCESSLTILSLVRLVFIMGSSPLDMSLKRVSAMDYNSF